MATVRMLRRSAALRGFGRAVPGVEVLGRGMTVRVREASISKEMKRTRSTNIAK
jgi:hypothetical protein